MGTCDALLHVSNVLQQALDRGYDARVVQIDFSAAFDRESHSGLLYKLHSVGVGGPLLSVLEEFLLNRRMRVVVDGSSSGFSDIISGVPQGSVLGPLLFNLCTADLFNTVENLLVGYADDSTLIAISEKPMHRIEVSDS